MTPTCWQRDQLPSALRQRCEVIHEGVDTNFFVMNPAWRPKECLRLTYATRGMEPMRGFPEFVEALPLLLRRHSNLEVVIAGDDRVAYGARLPEEGSFGRWAQRLLDPWIQRVRCGWLVISQLLPMPDCLRAVTCIATSPDPL